MRRVILIGLIGCIGYGVSLILFGLATPVAPDPSGELASAHNALQRGYTAVRELVRDLVDGFTAPLRGRTDRIITPGPLPQ